MQPMQRSEGAAALRQRRQASLSRGGRWTHLLGSDADHEVAQRLEGPEGVGADLEDEKGNGRVLTDEPVVGSREAREDPLASRRDRRLARRPGARAGR